MVSQQNNDFLFILWVKLFQMYVLDQTLKKLTMLKSKKGRHTSKVLSKYFILDTESLRMFQILGIIKHLGQKQILHFYNENIIINKKLKCK